jgi:hypothetical protein
MSKRRIADILMQARQARQARERAPMTKSTPLRVQVRKADQRRGRLREEAYAKAQNSHPDDVTEEEFRKAVEHARVIGDDDSLRKFDDAANEKAGVERYTVAGRGGEPTRVSIPERESPEDSPDIIGSTRSGKAIRADFDHEDHSDFTPQDHDDADRVHNEVVRSARDAGDFDTLQEHAILGAMHGELSRAQNYLDMPGVKDAGDNRMRGHRDRLAAVRSKGTRGSPEAMKEYKNMKVGFDEAHARMRAVKGADVEKRVSAPPAARLKRVKDEAKKAPKERAEKSMQVGPRGGKHYIAPSGKKVYIGSKG